MENTTGKKKTFCISSPATGTAVQNHIRTNSIIHPRLETASYYMMLIYE